MLEPFQGERGLILLVGLGGGGGVNLGPTSFEVDILEGRGAVVGQLVEAVGLCQVHRWVVVPALPLSRRNQAAVLQRLIQLFY